MWRFRKSVVVLLLAACGAAATGWSLDATDPGAGGRDGVPGAGTRAAPRRRAGRGGRAERPTADTPLAGGAESDETADDADASGDHPTLVTGRVVDESGAPVEGAQVAFFLGISTEMTKTDDSGAFRRDIQEPTGVVRCLAWADGRAVAVTGWRALRDRDRVDVGTIRLAPAARITGRMVGPDGEDAYGEVHVDGSDVFGAETWALIARTTGLADVDIPYFCSSTQAAFTVDSLPPGTYRLTPEAWRRMGDPVVVTPPAEDLVLRIPPLLEPAEPSHAPAPPSPCGTLTISGRVASCGAPLTWTNKGNDHRAGTPVSLSARRTDGGGDCAPATSAEDGTFRIEGLHAGEFDLWAEVDYRCRWGSGAPLASAHVRAEAGRDDVVIDLPVGFTRRFRVVLDSPADASSGAGPVAAAAFDEIDAWVGPAGESADSAALSHRDGGELVALGLRPYVAYDLVVRAKIAGVWTRKTYVSGWTGVVDADPDLAGRSPDAATSAATVAATTTVRLAPSFRITGRIVRADGSPVVGAYIYGNIVDTPHGADAYADLDGRFSLTGLEPGAWTVEASAPGLSNEGAEPVVGAGAKDVTVVVTTKRE